MKSDKANLSTPRFLTHHALRIKGFAKSTTLAEMTDLDVSEIEVHLHDMAVVELTMFRQARALWQLTPQGKVQYLVELEIDLESVDVAAMKSPYDKFLEINNAFKELCGDWQLRDGAINDHGDAQYDASVIKRLTELNLQAQPVVKELALIVPRLAPYPSRLQSTCSLVEGGTNNMFTGVMCGSFHDVWMELHEDLILTQRIDRVAEGSF